MKEKCQKNQRILVIDDSESIHEDLPVLNFKNHHLGRIRFQFGSTCLRIWASSSRLRYGHFS